MRTYIEKMESQPKWLKAVLCIWILDATWAVYRIGRAIVNKNTLHLVLGIIWVVLSVTFGWVVDLIFVLITGKIFWFEKD